MRPNQQTLIFMGGLCLSSSLWATPPADGFRILASSAHDYKIGGLLGQSQIINLQRGEKLRVKSLKTHEKCEIIGPYAQALKCARLLLTAERVRPRQRGAAQTPPSMWALDIKNGSDFCYRSPEELQLWRNDTNKASRLDIKGYVNEAQVRLRWPANQSLLNWPVKKLPLTDSSVYLFTLHNSTTAINFHKIPSNLSSFDEQTHWMQRQGCHTQLNAIKSSKDSQIIN